LYPFTLFKTLENAWGKAPLYKLSGIHMPTPAGPVKACHPTP